MQSSCAHLLPSTSRGGHVGIQRQADTAAQDFAELSSDVESASSALSHCLELWDDYERSHAGLLKWLQQTEKDLKSPLELQPTLERKEDQLRQVQVGLISIFFFCILFIIIVVCLCSA